VPHAASQGWEIKPVTRSNLIATLVLISTLIGCSALKDSPEGARAHPAGWINSHTETALAAYGDGQQTFCQSCHGVDYSGGTSGVSCVNCHQTRGDGECIACHGGVDNFTGAPPANLHGDTAFDARGVGAHTTMVEGFAYTNGFDCSECHLKPSFVFTPGHFEPEDVLHDEHSDVEPHAEVTFSVFSDPEGNATYDTVFGGCGNIYCHGNFVGGNDSNYVFTFLDRSTDTAFYLQFSQARCGSCHNIAGDSATWDASHAEHVEDQNFDCVECHDGIASTAPDSVILDRTLHVNGLRDIAFDTSAGVSATWNPAAQTCSNVACHGDTTKTWVR
jgi:hypothetical protein